MRRVAIYIMQLLLCFAPLAAMSQHSADNTARERAVEYYYLQAISMLEQDSLDASFELLEHCRMLAPGSSAVQYDLSAFYQFLGKDSLAHEMLEDIVAKEPLNMKYCEALVEYYYRINDKKSAIALYEQMLEHVDSKSDIYMSLYTLYSDEKEFEKAIDVLDKLEKAEGKSEVISLHRVKQLVMLQDSARALAAVEKMIEENPEDLQYQALQGDIYSMFGDFERSEQIYLSVVEKDSGDISSLTSLSNLYLMSERDSLYCDVVERLLKSERLGVEQRISILFDYSRYKDERDSTYVTSFFEEMLELPFDRLEVADLYVQYLLYRNAAPEKVIPVLDTILSIEPDNRSALLQQLLFAIERNDYEGVIKCSDNAILYIPDMLELYYYKGIALSLLNRDKETAEVLELGLSRRSSESAVEITAKSFSVLGDVYHDLGLIDKCTEAYDSALIYNPSEISVLNNYAYYLSLEGKELERALAMSAKTIEAEPDNAIYVDTYAWILFSLERYEEAKAYADKLLQLDGEKSSVEYHHCGDIYAKCGDVARAVECWEKARELGDTSKILKKKIKKRKYYSR